MNTTLTMSKKERDRLDAVKRLEHNQLSHCDAAAELGISERTVYRSTAKYKLHGEAGVIHGLRGRVSNRGYSRDKREEVLSLYRQMYSDYGATLFSETLLADHNITMSVETLRRWLKRANLNAPSRKGCKHRQKRARRESIGDMIQLDGSTHDWFEGRAPECCLLHIIDDASGLVFLRFAKSENTFDVQSIMKDYIRAYGIPRSVYTDGGSVYYHGNDKTTDFAYAMAELNIEMIHARSPQAKGRVERGNRTHQDRLIKAMRRNNISSIAQANAYLDSTYLKEHNAKFAHTESLTEAHRDATGVDLDHILCFRVDRSVKNDSTVQLHNEFYLLLGPIDSLPRPKAKVQLRLHLDDSLHCHFKGTELKIRNVTDQPRSKHKPARLVSQVHPWKSRGKQVGVGSKGGCSTREIIRQRIALSKSNY